MKTTAMLATTCALLVVLWGRAAAPPATAAEDETAAVTKRWAEFSAAWAKHDPKALAALWAEDGDLVNPWGRLASGRAEVEKLFADEQTGTGPMRTSTFKSSGERVRFPSADVAVSDAEVTIDGVLPPDGSKPPPQEFHVTFVWKKSGGTWSIHSGRPYLKVARPGPTTK